MKYLVVLLGAAVALASTNRLAAQDPKELQAQVDQLKKDVALLQGQLAAHEKKLVDVRAEIKDVADSTTASIQKLQKVASEIDNRAGQAINILHKKIDETDIIVKEISKRDGQGNYIIDLGNMQKSAEFKNEFKGAVGTSGTSRSIFFVNRHDHDVLLYVNGVRWRFLGNTRHYISVPYGKVYLQHHPEGQPVILPVTNTLPALAIDVSAIEAHQGSHVTGSSPSPHAPRAPEIELR